MGIYFLNMGNVYGYLYSFIVTDNTTNNTNQEEKKFMINESNSALIQLKKDPSNMSEVLEFKLINKKQISPDTFIYSYEIPNNMNLGLNLGHHIAMGAIVEGEDGPEEVCRKYTPTSTIYENGKFDLLVKVYFKDVHPKFPRGGMMSQNLNDIKLNESIKVRGPFGKLTYLGEGNFKILKSFKPLTYKEKKYKKIGMLAGGTGITPFYQILQAANIQKDACEWSMIFGNKSTTDILLKEELENLSKSETLNFKPFFTIDSKTPEENWTGGVGFITKEMIKERLPAPSDDTLILMCGPPVMCTKVLMPYLEEMGYSKDDIFGF